MDAARLFINGRKREGGGEEGHRESDETLLLVKPLVTYIEPLSADDYVTDVADAFFRAPEIDAFPLASKAERIIGLVTRTVLSRSLFSKFGHALYGKEKIGNLSLQAPVVVNVNSRVDAALERALERPQDYIYDDIIVRDGEGFYTGMLSVRKMILRQGAALAHTIAKREIADRRTEELERINKVKSAFLSNVTHELRAPVNTMIGLGELMHVACETENIHKLKEYASTLLTSASNLRALVNNILDLTKMEAGKMKIVTETFDFRDLVREAAGMLKVLVRGKEIDVITDLPGGEISILSDPVKVRQIVANLANNAAKFTERGSIRLSAKEEGDAVVFQINDTGIGIKQEDQQKLFQAFSQVEDAKTRSREGSGLGLSITLRLLDLLGGKVDFESTYGEGTAFRVRLPLKHRKGETVE